MLKPIASIGVAHLRASFELEKLAEPGPKGYQFSFLSKK
tara:strand:+ start:386 stop:502 length:117 start_codon:yes stop_codon:yes gene_type:complete